MLPPELIIHINMFHHNINSLLVCKEWNCYLINDFYWNIRHEMLKIGPNASIQMALNDGRAKKMFLQLSNGKNYYNENSFTWNCPLKRVYLSYFSGQSLNELEYSLAQMLVLNAFKYNHLEMFDDSWSWFHLIETNMKYALQNCELSFVQKMMNMFELEVREDWILCACVSGKLEMMEYLISLPSQLNVDYNLLLTMAVVSHHLPIVQFIVEKGAPTNLNDAFKLACNKGDYDIVDYFIHVGVDLNVDDGYPIRWSAYKGINPIYFRSSRCSGVVNSIWSKYSLQMFGLGV